MAKPKILTLDIETKPGTAYVWRLFKENIPNERLIEPDGILCIGAKWHGEDKVHMFTDWKHGQREMLQKISEMVSEADGIVTYNGKKFDIPYITTGLMTHDLPPLPPVAHIDLFQFIRNKTKFMSKKLGFVAPELGIGEKIKHEGFQLWIDVMNGNKEAQKKMEEYCVGDVVLTEQFYDKVHPYIENHPTLGEHDKESCPHCKSLKTQRRGKGFTKAMWYQRYQCTNCGAWFKGVYKRIEAKPDDANE